MQKKSLHNSVPRINFIEKEPFVLTYKRMAIYGGIFVGLCVLFVGGQWAYVQSKAAKVVALENEVKVLRADRDQKFRQMVAIKGPKNAQESLVSLFESAPPWTAILKELTAVTPRSLWLTNLKTMREGVIGDVSAGVKLQLIGQAEEAASIAQFLKILSGSSFFQNVVLTSSKREDSDHGPVYSFAVDLLLAPSEGKGL